MNEQYYFSDNNKHTERRFTSSCGRQRSKIRIGAAWLTSPDKSKIQKHVKNSRKNDIKHSRNHWKYGSMHTRMEEHVPKINKSQVRHSWVTQTGGKREEGNNFK